MGTHAEKANETSAPNRAVERRKHWDAVARRQDKWSGLGGYYHRYLKHVYGLLVAPGRRVLELGCGKGDLLASLEPSRGVGIDLSPEMVARARERHPDLEFVCADVHRLELDETFDVIILSDLLNDVADVQEIFRRMAPLCTPATRILINVHSQAWRPALSTAKAMRLATPLLPQNWLTVHDVSHLLYLTDFEVIRSWQELLLPLPLPPISWLFNRYFAKISPFRHAALANMILARPAPWPTLPASLPTVSVIVAARNEAGNIEQIFERVPEMGAGTELIFVEGGSTDDTYEVIRKMIPKYPDRRCKLFRQGGTGKGDAVRLGFAEATGDILMILDADLTVPPEDLPRFYEALFSGKAEFVNGVRLVYPMEKRAMRYFNLLGNKFFSLAFSWLLGQPVKDTLCGTKVLWKKDYELIAANREYFGDFDPFGDFDLLFGAVKLNLRIVDLPVRYRERTYGDTNISRWRHGLLLLRMVLFAARRIKFI